MQNLMFPHNYYIFLTTLKNYKIMQTITREQIHELCQILGNISGLEIALQRAIDSNNLELIGRVQTYLTVVKERLESAIDDIDR